MRYSSKIKSRDTLIDINLYNLIKAVYCIAIIIDAFNIEALLGLNLRSINSDLGLTAIYRNTNIYPRISVYRYFYFNIKTYEDYFIKFF